MDQRLNYVDGEWTESSSGETFENRNPAAPDEVVSVHQQGTEEDAEAAVRAASEAREEWAATPGPERGSYLREAASILEDRADEIAETLTREEGKTIDESTPEVGRAIDILYYYAERASDYRGDVSNPGGDRRNLYTLREPKGVAGLVTPWNYPIAIPAWKLAPALATGNTVVLKPATLAPLVAAEIVDALDEAGIPDGVVNMVTGPGSTVGETIITHDDVDAVSFTGSAQVGYHVYDAATDNMTRVQTEMGGKNPTIVTESADVGKAVDVVGAGAFGVTGQACTACSRAIVHESVYEEFVDGIVDYAESIEVGPGLDGADMGPQVSDDELEATLDYIDVGRSEGGTLEAGGGTPEGLGDGYFVEPTVFSGVDQDDRLAQEEIFGPVLAVIPVSDFDEAVAVANNSQYGLSASVVTDRLAEANRFVDEIEAGIVKINEKTTGVDLHVPFGGFKDSSSETYREQGDAGMDFFTITKTVYVNE